MEKIFAFVFFFCLFSEVSEARWISGQVGIGNWYSDDLKSSFQYGGGVLVRPGLDWLELEASYDRAPVSIKSGEALASALKGRALSFWRIGLTFPSRLEAMGLQALLFPLVSYVLTDHADKLSHGFGIGGGLEFFLWKEIIGARFEAIEQTYKIPLSTGATAFQEDFFFALRLTANY